ARRVKVAQIAPDGLGHASIADLLVDAHQDLRVLAEKMEVRREPPSTRAETIARLAVIKDGKGLNAARGIVAALVIEAAVSFGVSLWVRLWYSWALSRSCPAGQDVFRPGRARAERARL